MQGNDNEQTRFAATLSTAMKRKNNSKERNVSNQTAHVHTRLGEDREQKAVNSSVKTSTDVVQHQYETSSLTRYRRISEFESLLCRSHSVDESAIQNMSLGKEIYLQTDIQGLFPTHELFIFICMYWKSLIINLSAWFT